MIANLSRSLVLSLFLTELIELLFTYLIGIRNKKDYLLIVLINVVTNPCVVLTAYLLHHYTTILTPFYILPLELMVILIEGLYLRTYSESIDHPFRFACALNVCSYVTGLLISLII